ncbi:MAG: hypothetical protein P4L55_07685 [Syntrophobacteraceae bacterium]|nr:hypothetical protein [Syntrophobacteraceae bacterium]
MVVKGAISLYSALHGGVKVTFGLSPPPKIRNPAATIRNDLQIAKNRARIQHEQQEASRASRSSEKVEGMERVLVEQFERRGKRLL